MVVSSGKTLLDTDYVDLVQTGCRLAAMVASFLSPHMMP